MSTQVSWDDYRTAYTVAIEGSLSQAAKLLNVNHATVLRHINRLEQSLGLKLFIRHQRGYQLTDAGRVMIAELPQIQHHFSRLENQLQDVATKLSGTLRITTVPTYSSRLNPTLLALREKYPDLRIDISATDEIIPLEKGMVHVAIRPGRKPDGPDLIVRQITETKMGFYATKTYLEKYGIPDRSCDFNRFHWVLPSGAKRNISFVKPILNRINNTSLVYQSNHFLDITNAIVTGIGIGPIDGFTANQYEHLQQVDVMDEISTESLWFVYHKDLKHSKKISTLYDYIMKYLAEPQQNQLGPLGTTTSTSSTG